MTRADAARFASNLAAMAAVFEREISKQVTEAYFRSLESFSIDDVEAGIARACKMLKFWPKPVEIIECITGGGVRLEDKAEVEACKVLGAIKEIGTYRTVAFDDPVTQAVIVQHFGGWTRFSEMLEENEKWFIRDFVAAYQAFARSGIKYFGALPGISSGQNALKGIDRKEEPALIGDQEKAKAVLATGRLNALPDGEGLRHIGTALGNWKRPVSEQQQ